MADSEIDLDRVVMACRRIVAFDHDTFESDPDQYGAMLLELRAALAGGPTEDTRCIRPECRNPGFAGEPVCAAHLITEWNQQRGEIRRLRELLYQVHDRWRDGFISRQDLGPVADRLIEFADHRGRGTP